MAPPRHSFNIFVLVSSYGHCHPSQQSNPLHEAPNPTEITQQKHSTAITRLPFYTAFSLFSLVVNFIPRCHHPDNAPIRRSHAEFSKPHSADQRIRPRGSRTSGGVLQTALCYLEAIRSKVPELLRKESMGEGLNEEMALDCRIVRGANLQFDLDPEANSDMSSEKRS
jgi:hypothetical protein